MTAGPTGHIRQQREDVGDTPQFKLFLRIHAEMLVHVRFSICVCVCQKTPARARLGSFRALKVTEVFHNFHSSAACLQRRSQYKTSLRNPYHREK